MHVSGSRIGLPFVFMYLYLLTEDAGLLIRPTAVGKIKDTKECHCHRLPNKEWACR